ncbi:hypothetical protein DXG03_006263 [Asterophora parasitica]|uniref:Uncharacterized protein n=1 Tax=Asterophora parasitica TaxID=117018 RepID=A0A9P7G9I8_9AGAR|nr:hypothetical protein DXG03_006263 [Asterophora parasitica]
MSTVTSFHLGVPHSLSMRPTLVTPRPYSTRPSLKEKPKIPSIIIPPTPINTCSASLPPYDKYAPLVQIQLQPSTITPPSSALSASTASTSTSTLEPDMTRSCGEGGSPTDIVAIAELFATLKKTVATLHTTFDRLGTQTEKLAQLAPAMKADQQANFCAKLENQIVSHENTMQEVRRLLEDTIKDSLVDHLKSQVFGAIRESVAKELKIQIPEKLREQGKAHQREIVEVQTNLHNSDARRHNASLRSPSMTTEPLRPLLRPLPSALQSPAYVSKRPWAAYPSMATAVPSPMTPFPGVPTPTPLTLKVPALMVPPGSNQVFELIPPTPSPLFPRDLGSLFALGPDAAKRLLQDYGLDSTASAGPSPSIEKPRAKAPLTKTGLNTPEDSPKREEDINKFMAHIGVPLLMVPAPKPKGHACTSTSPSPKNPVENLSLLIVSNN